MPVDAYYGNHGQEVIKKMVSRYGRKKGKSVFYATANKNGQTPEDKTAFQYSRKKRR